MSITVAALDITDLTTNGLLFEFRDGQPSRISTYRGTDDVVPTASGMDPGKWTAGTRELRLYGQVIGEGATPALQQASFRSRMAALIAVMDVNTLVTITTANEFGAASATLTDCRPMRMTTEAEFASITWIGYLDLTCIKSPPDWAVTP